MKIGYVRLALPLVAILLAGSPAVGDQHALRTLRFQSTTADFPNPERGFYRFRDLTRPARFEQVRAAGHSLIYGRVLASRFRDRPLSDAFLDQIQAGFDQAREYGLKVKFRLTYNDGFEPDAPKDIVLTHISQLRPLWERNQDVLFHMDAGFIGAWGEWHHSTNGLDHPTHRRDILLAILDALPSGRSVGVRTPHFKREIFAGSPSSDAQVITAESAFDGSDLSRVGHVNDCFLSSPSDMGTYINPGGNWPIERELDYIGQESQFVPFGGETCALHARNEMDHAIAEMERLHIDYLNFDWHPDVVNRWREDGRLDEISRRLGYRFELVTAELPTAVRPGGLLPLDFEIDNTGFGELFNARQVKVALRNNSSGQMVTAPLSLDPRRWAGGQRSQVSSQLVVPRALPAGTYSIGLWLPDLAETLQDDIRYAVRFANESVWDETTGVNWLSHALAISDAAPGEVYRQQDFGEVLDVDSLRPLGDLDNDGDCDADDIDRLSQILRDGLHDAEYDLNDDGQVTDADRRMLIEELKRTSLGDANLDGRFDSLDLVAVLRGGRFEGGALENGRAAGWADGDWNGDGSFDTRDFVAAFQAGGYRSEQAAAVPEPSSLVILWSSLILFLTARLRWSWL